jgi:hypothetical protein
MKRYLIPIMIILLAGAASGNIWLNDESLYLMDTTHFVTPYFKPANMSPFEIIDAPYFGLVGANLGSIQTISSEQPVSLGGSETTSTNSATSSTSSAPVFIKSTPAETAPPHVDFSGNLENNLHYAESKSSLRVGQAYGAGWTNLQNPWLIK